MRRVVLDSNVLISALHFGGKPEELLLLANQGGIELFVSPYILDETARILKTKLAWKEREVQAILKLLKEIATGVDPKLTVDVISVDKADNHILACALEAHADFLVTGDKRHLLPLKHYRGTQILTPHRFIELLYS